MKVVDLDDVLADLDATSARYDFWRVNWVPKSDKALLWAATAIPRERVEAGRRLPRGPVRAGARRRLQGAGQARRHGPAAQRAAGARLRRPGAHLRRARLHGPAAQHAAGGPPRPAARGDGRVELPAAGPAARARRVRGVLRRARLAEHPDRDRADQGGREPHVGVELGRAALHREAQLHVPHRGLHGAGGEGGHLHPPPRPLGAPRARRHPVQGALGEDQLHRPRVRAPQPRRRRVPAAGLADVPERLPAERAPSRRADRHPRPPGHERVPLGPRPAPPLLDGAGAHVQPAGQPERLQDAREGRGQRAVVLAARPRAAVPRVPAHPLLRALLRRRAPAPEARTRGRTCWRRWTTMERQVARAERFELARSNAELDARARGREDRDRPHRRGRPRPRPPVWPRTTCPAGSPALDQLADRGVASLTLAHLFPNDLAGHAEAIPAGPAQVPDLPARHGRRPLARPDRRGPRRGRAHGRAPHRPRRHALHARSPGGRSTSSSTTASRSSRRTSACGR